MFIEIEDDSYESEPYTSPIQKKTDFTNIEQVAEGYQTKIFAQNDLIIKASKHREQGPCPVQFHSQACCLLENEFDIVKNQLNHPNIIQYHYIERNCSILNKEYCAIVMDRMQGDFYDYYIQEETYRNNFNIVQFKLHFAKLVSAVGFMHAQGVSHNDIKPENILLRPVAYQQKQINNFTNQDHCQNDFSFSQAAQSISCQNSDDNGQFEVIYEPVLSDFGCATNYQQIGALNAQKQRENWNKRDLSYMGAEVNEFLSTSNGSGFDEFKNDIFSLGQCLFICLTKQFPRRFKIPTSKCPIYQQIIKQDVKGFWNQLKDQCIYFKNFDICHDFLDICMKMMAHDPQERPSPIEILRHKFFEDVLHLI